MLIMLLHADDFSTSPSIYANFHDITVEVSPNEVAENVVCSIVPVSMLTFSPGELSTLQGGIHMGVDQVGGGPYDNRPLPPQPYNFSDLPCPPQDVMVLLLAIQLENSTDRLAGGKLAYARTWCALPT